MVTHIFTCIQYNNNQWHNYYTSLALTNNHNITTFIHLLTIKGIPTLFLSSLVLNKNWWFVIKLRK